MIGVEPSAEERMRRFIASASHELRTPLTVILGYLDALRKTSSDHVQQFERAYPIISAEGQRMRVLIDNMSLLTKLDQPQASRIEIVDLAKLAGEIIRALSIFADSERFVMDFESGVLIPGNREELFAALRNLVENALKYAPLWRITIRTTYDEQSAIIDVSDEGPGIDVAGSGLELPIASRAVERAGGT